MAANGQEALRLFQGIHQGVSLVLLDLTMPEMDGERTLHALRALRPEVPVVMSSGYTEQEITARLAGQGVAGFIQKPYTQASLLATVRTAIEGR
jgi:CheY-like chemotaxis protein